MKPHCMSRRFFIKSLSVTAAAALLPAKLGAGGDKEHPDIVEELAAMLKNIRDSGRTRKYE